MKNKLRNIGKFLLSQQKHWSRKGLLTHLITRFVSFQYFISRYNCRLDILKKHSNVILKKLTREKCMNRALLATTVPTNNRKVWRTQFVAKSILGELNLSCCYNFRPIFLSWSVVACHQVTPVTPRAFVGVIFAFPGSACLLACLPTHC